MSGQIDLFDEAWKRARRTDPETSFEAAAAVSVTQQARVILSAYADGAELLDVEAYRKAGFPPHACDGQRCSDLRRNGLIERTGEKRKTPSGRPGYVCAITRKGIAFLSGAA